MKLQSVASGLHGRPRGSPVTTAASLGREAIFDDTRRLDESKTAGSVNNCDCEARKGLSACGPRHSWAVISQISEGRATGDVVTLFGGDQAHSLFFRRCGGRQHLATAFGARKRGKWRVSNQKSVTAWQASVIRPWRCQGRPSQKPRLSFSFFAEIDAADDLIGSGFEAESPVPGFAAFDGG